MQRQIQKVVLIGKQAVGKTSIIQRFISNNFGDTKATAGATFYQKQLQVNEDRVTLNIWDTAGEEKFRAMQAMFYRNAKIILIVFDVLDEVSFADVSYWFEQIRSICAEGSYKVIIVGNKIDFRAITSDEQQKFQDKAKLENCELQLCSAKTGENIDALFQKAAQLALTVQNATEKPLKTTQSIIVDDDFDGGHAQKKGKGGCC